MFLRRIFTSLIYIFFATSCFSDIHLKKPAIYSNHDINPEDYTYHIQESGESKKISKKYNSQGKSREKNFFEKIKEKIDNSFNKKIPDKKPKIRHIQKTTKNPFLLKKVTNKNLTISKVYIMGATLSKDKDGKVKTKDKKIYTYTYHIIGELHNKSEKTVNENDELYLDLKVYFREEDEMEHVEYKNEKYMLNQLGDFDNPGKKIKLPIQKNGGFRLFEIKIDEIPESDHKVGLFLILRSKEEIWSTNYIALHRPPPPPVKEKFFDFLRRPTSTKWWYLTLAVSFIAILIAMIALI